MKANRILSLLAALVLICGMVPLAAAEDAAALEPVTLEWYVSEDSQPDNQTVFDALNAYLKEKINTTINFHFINNSEYSTKVSPILESGQEVDIINANSQLSYVNYAKKESFLPMEELLPQYAPETYKMIPEGFWDAMKIDGHIYGIPSYKDSVQSYCFMINDTLAQELGLDYSSLAPKSFKDVVPFLYEAYEKRNELHPEDKEAGIPICRTFPDLEQYMPYETINGLAVVNIPGVENYEGMGSGEKVFNKYATAEYREACKLIAKMITDGVLPADCWYYDPDRIYTAQGKYIMGDIGSGYVTVAKNYYSDDWDTVMLPYAYRTASTNYLHAAVNCISATSKNPERAMMALELINTDPYVATTLRLGVEGVHWKMSDVEGVATFDGTKNADPSAPAHKYWYGAQFGALVHSVVAPGYPANFMELLIEANESAITETNLGFIFDPTPVQNEIAACNAVIGEYETNLKFGFIPEDEVDANVDEFLAKLDASGAEKIVAEAQAQLDAWRAVNK